MKLERMIVISALVATAMSVAMLAIAVSSGVTQEYFEMVHPLNEYVARLLAQGTTLHWVFTLDNVFLTAYGTFFLALGAERWGKAPSLLVVAMVLLTLVPATLDVLENHHILAMLRSAELGLPISLSEIEFQMIASAAKFHLSYIGAIALGAIYPTDTRLERMVAVSVGVGYPLLGLSIATAPSGWVMPLALGRVFFFVTGYLLSAVVYARRGMASSRPGNAVVSRAVTA